MRRFSDSVSLLVILSLAVLIVPAAASPLASASDIYSTSTSRQTAGSPKSAVPSGTGVGTSAAQANYFKGHFYVNQSSPKGNFTTLKVGASSKLDFAVTPAMDITKATLNMTMPLMMIYASGSTFFSGDLKAGVQANLTSTLFAMRETYSEIHVQAAGTVTPSSSQAPFMIREDYFLTVNTTLWTTVTKPDPNGPQPKNSTNVPSLNVTETFMGLAQKSVTPESPGTVISGQLFYSDENGNQQFMRHAKVLIWNDVFCIGCNHELGDVLTGNDGHFSWDYTGGSAINPHLYAYPEASCCGFDLAEVRPFPGFYYRVDVASLSNVQPNAAGIDIGGRIPVGDNSAWQIFDAIYSAYLRVTSSGFTPNWTQEVYWPVPFIPTPNTNIFVDASINMADKGNYAWVHYHVQHEYGHAIMWHTMGGLGNFPCNVNCIRSHSLNLASDSGFAMSEGWAEFMQGWVDNNANDVTLNGCAGNIETGAFFSCGGGPNDGNIVEGSVAGVFWDMYDSGVSEPGALVGHDDLQTHHAFNLAPILGPGGIFPTNHPGSILQFFSLWVARFPADYSLLHTIYTTYNVQNLPAPAPSISLTGVLLVGLILGTIIFATQRTSKLSRPKRQRRFSAEE